MDDIKVSVICNAYNHKPFIKECLEGLVCQKTNFKYEILVHDDASTDGTDSIIKEYEAKYPDLIKPIYQKENQYSKGGIGKFQYTRVKGKYIAMCEGDDYWSDDNKLRIQYEALENNPDVDICAHTATMIDGMNGKFIRYISPSNEDKIIDASDVIAGDGGFVATNSLMYRAELNDDLPEFRKLLNMDYTIQIHGSLRGGMLFLNKNMSVYRYMTPGSWSEKTYKTIEAQREFNLKKRRMLVQLDADTDGRYKNAIYSKIFQDDYDFYTSTNNYKELLQEKYEMYISQLPFIKRLQIKVGASCPWLVNIKRIFIHVK